jgi:hypothetical protein
MRLYHEEHYELSDVVASRDVQGDLCSRSAALSKVRAFAFYQRRDKKVLMVSCRPDFSDGNNAEV